MCVQWIDCSDVEVMIHLANRACFMYIWKAFTSEFSILSSASLHSPGVHHAEADRTKARE